MLLRECNQEANTAQKDQSKKCVNRKIRWLIYISAQTAMKDCRVPMKKSKYLGGKRSA